MSFRYEHLPALQEQLQAGKTTCRQVVLHYLEQCKQQQHLNAFLEVFEHDALAQADQLDQQRNSGNPLGKLHGLVFAVKDVIVVKGKEATASSKILSGFKSLYTATCVERLLAEGAILIGRTNCDEFAMGSSNETSFFGPVLNAADPTRVPGGSSGGSAVAVQAGMCMAALGTDTGGSIRQPASLTGTVGFKPTYGRISRYGMIAYASSFDQCGTFTTNAIDAALMLEVMAGFDPHDATSSAEPVESYAAGLQHPSTLRIAWYPQTIESDKIDPEIKQQFQQLLQQLQDAGHTVEAVNFPDLNYLVPTYYVLTTAEASSNLSRFSGIHYGYRTEKSGTIDEVIRYSRSEGFGKEVKRRIMLGTFVLSSGYYDAYYTHAQKVRGMIRRNTLQVLESYDIILTPTTPSTAFKLGEKTTDPIEMYLADIYTVQAPIAGIPAISVPICRHSNGLPFGIQIMAAPFQELMLLNVTAYLQDQFS